MKIKEFNKLPKAEQRVLIAKGALKQLKTDVYNTSHTFLHIELAKEPEENESLQEYLEPSNIEECNVCALGALMVSSVRKKNNLFYSQYYMSVKPHNQHDGYGSVLTKVFSLKQIILIENAYEMGTGAYNTSPNIGYGLLGCYKKDDRILQKAIAFGKAYEDDTERMEAILKNIIKNKGSFKP